MTASGASEALPRKGLILLAALSLFWGANWPAMKLALGDIPPWTFRAVCVSFGGLGLLAITRLAGHSLKIPKAEMKGMLLCAFFGNLCWHLLSAFALRQVGAGHAAIIAYTMPLWATLLGLWLLKERLTIYKVGGLALGLGGMALLAAPTLGSVGDSPIGALMMLGAALSWAIGTVLFKYFHFTISSTAVAGWQLTLAAAPIVIGAAIFEGVPDFASYSVEAWSGLIYAITFPMIFCHWAWFVIVRLFPATVAAISTLAIPVVGVLSSALVLGEVIGWREVIALALVCLGLATVLVLPGLVARRGSA